MILGQVKALAAGPLLSAGYGRIGIDGGWVCQNDAARATACVCGGVGGSYHDKDGEPVVGLGRFPNLKNLTDEAHALGVKLDFYGNSCNCAGEEQKVWKAQGGNPEKDVAALATYGMDGIKVDGCSPAHNITRWVAALDALPGPRELLLENCGDNGDTWRRPAVSAVGGNCGFQMYRISPDIAPQFYSTMFNLQAMIPYADVSHPGCWSYPDMLQVGSPRLSELEARTHFAAWCVSSAPLILGYDLADAAASARAEKIVGNTVAIAISQAWSGHAGGVLSQSAENFSATTHHGAGDGAGGNTSFPVWQIWSKPLSSSKHALLLINLSPEPRDITANLAALKLDAAAAISLQDVWSHARVAHSGSSYTAKQVPGHGSSFVIAEAASVHPETTKMKHDDVGRDSTTLTHGWKFQLGDLLYNGGPVECADDLKTAFPLILTGKQCAMGPRDAWAVIEAGNKNNHPDDCARACCTSDNCTMWTWFNGSTSPDEKRRLQGGQSFRTYGACVLGFGTHDTSTDCISEGGVGWLGAARTLPVIPRPPPPHVAGGAEEADFDDRAWRQLSIPHDFVIEGTPCLVPLGCIPSETNPSNNMHGSYPKGVGWYRTTFLADASTTAAVSGRVTWLHFEGVLNDAMIFVNGKFLARRFSSYSGFSVELPSSLLKASNVLAVRADSRTNEGWFYEGGGLHRPVHLLSAGSVRVAEHGVYVVATPTGSLSGVTTAPTDIALSAELVNSGASAALDVTVLQAVIDVDTDTLVHTVKTTVSIQATTNKTATQAMHLPLAKLWSLETPKLYTLRTRLMQDGSQVDEINVTFGVRRSVFDVNTGFALNDVKIQLKGFCMHESFGGTGSAIPPTVNDFRITKLKELGTNAWRGAHEPVAESLLDSADKLGMLMVRRLSLRCLIAR